MPFLGCRYPKVVDLDYDPGEAVRARRNREWRNEPLALARHPKVYAHDGAEHALDKDIQQAEDMVFRALLSSNLRVEELRLWALEWDTAELLALPLRHTSNIDVADLTSRTLAKLHINVTYLEHHQSGNSDAKALTRALQSLTKLEELSIECQHPFAESDKRIRAKDPVWPGRRGGTEDDNAIAYFWMLENMLQASHFPALKALQLQNYSFEHAKDWS